MREKLLPAVEGTKSKSRKEKINISRRKVLLAIPLVISAAILVSCEGRGGINGGGGSPSGGG